MMKNILLHVHIFKNAGSSFDDALSHFFKDAFVDHREDEALRKGKMSYLTEYFDKHPKIEAFSSHSIYFMPENTEKYSFHPVYFLRHPVDRIRSVYSFEKKQMPAITQGAIKAKELCFEDYVAWYMQDDAPATIRNVQTIFLSGGGAAPSKMNEKFTVALENLKQTPCIGVVDRYDESMVVFEEYLKAFFPGIDLSYIRRNVTDNRFEVTVGEKAEKLLDQLDVSLRKIVLEKNALDFKLYREANEQLDTKIKNIPNFAEKLQNFQDRCVLRHIKQEDHSQTVTLLEPLVQRSSNNVNVYLALANAYKHLKQYNQSLNTYEQAMKNFPNNPWAYFHQAEMYGLMGEKEKAEQLFKMYAVQFSGHENVIAAFKRLG